MGVMPLMTARDMHAVATPQEYTQRHRLALAQKRARGQRVAESYSTEPVTARVDCGRWIVDCSCGAGNAADPEWSEARCFGCGKVHLVVVFPVDAAAIEVELTLRPKEQDQNWRPGTSTKQLRDENVKRGLAVREELK